MLIRHLTVLFNIECKAEIKYVNVTKIIRTKVQFKLQCFTQLWNEWG
jgi:hypothetical protein